MRILLALLVGFSCLASASAQEKKLATRYGVDADTDAFSQKTAKDALASVLKAIQTKKIDYLAAQLSDPAFVDKRVKENHGGQFEDFVKEITANLLDDPDRVKQLNHYLKAGKWEEGENSAAVEVKDAKEKVFFKKLEGRWFLENRKKADKTDK